MTEFERLNTRKTSVVQVGGFRPTGDRFASNFGIGPMALPGEAWPTSGERPMLFVCQLNLTTAPDVPALLEDIQLLTFFVTADGEPRGKENGDDWQLFAYTSMNELTAMVRPGDAPSVKRGFECRWEVCDDHPTSDDPDRVVPEGFDDSEVELDNVPRTKIGGYPSTIQSEPWWDYEPHPAEPKYCLQINNEEKAGVVWGDGGTIYLARGTAEGASGRWFLDLQSY